MRKKKTFFIGVAAILTGLVIWYLFSLPRVMFKAPVSAVLEGNDGTLLSARIASDGQWRFPMADSVPSRFAAAIINYEDKRFRRHLGVDFLSIGNALRSNIRGEGIRRGASTITMQTIRLSRGNKKRTVGTKIIEAILATRLELRCSKKEILLLYASNAPFGGNVVGLEAAAWRYFGRGADELSWAESAMLAVLPNSPSLVHPGRNRDKLLYKRNFLLDKLAQAGIIDSLQCALAKDEELPEQPCAMPDIAPHYLETLRIAGGDKLYRSDIIPSLQLKVEHIAERDIEVFRSNKVNNLAAIVLEVKSGNIIAYCGNVPGNGIDVGQSVDVVQAPRSSGSTLKPFLYSAMLDEGDILPTMLISDIPFNYKNFSPRNFNNTFDGAVPAREVIQRSLNVPSVRMLNEYGIEKFVLLLKEMGFSTINRGGDTYGLSLILGGAEITLCDLAFAYRSMAAKLSSFGAEDDVFEKLPLSAGAIWCTFDALSMVNRPEEEGEWKSFSSTRKIAWKTGTSFGNRDAWSIGVTPDYVVGVWAGNCDGEGRPNLTGIGYAAPVMFDIFDKLPQTGWFDIPENDLEEIVVCKKSGHPISERCVVGGVRSDNVQLDGARSDKATARGSRSDVYMSGGTMVDGNLSKGSRSDGDLADGALDGRARSDVMLSNGPMSEAVADTVLAPYAPDRPEVCPYHHILHLSSDGQYIVNSECYSVSKMKTVSWFTLPPAQEWYYIRSHSDYKRTPPYHPLMGNDMDNLPGATSRLDIVYPQEVCMSPPP